MDKLLAVLVFALAIGLLTVGFPVAPLAILFGAVCSGIVIALINKNFNAEEKSLSEEFLSSG